MQHKKLLHLMQHKKLPIVTDKKFKLRSLCSFLINLVNMLTISNNIIRHN